MSTDRKVERKERGRENHHTTQPADNTGEMAGGGGKLPLSTKDTDTGRVTEEAPRL